MIQLALHYLLLCLVTCRSSRRNESVLILLAMKSERILGTRVKNVGENNDKASTLRPEERNNREQGMTRGRVKLRRTRAVPKPSHHEILIALSFLFWACHFRFPVM